MTRKDLKGLKYLIEWNKEMLEGYEERKEKAYGLSHSIDGMPKGFNKSNYALEELIDSYNEILINLKKEQDKINEIIKQMQKLDPIFRQIITKKYIKGYNIEKIAIDIGYDYYNTCKLHKKALDEFDKLDKK